MWHCSEDGRFSVKSAYNLITVEQMRDTASSSNVGVPFDWKMVWNVEVPQKIKMLAWRGVRDVVASHGNLARRGVTLELTCPMKIPRENLREWCSSVWKFVKDLNWWSLFWSIAWGVWLRRNGWTFDRKRMVGTDVIRKAVSIVGKFELAKEVRNTNPHAMLFETRWKPPLAGVIKLNSDAALLSPNEVGFGGAMRDYVGDVVVATCFRMEGGFDVDIAEALAMRHALSITMEAGFLRLCLETNCLKLHSHLKKGYVTPTPFGRIVSDILTLSRLCHFCSSSFVKRDGNRVAHGLAKACNQFSNLRVWLEECPSDVMELVLADLSHNDA
ncbi:uncharacterized protein LOC110728362 [Chenopodium quinoa]|uniref:uncharacterized protein LOC110728362 n=1 Tax=Chenopodium quinoa TaxID=63459 RepID=UPI000B78A755|nr:uncharacterized protein LOC110728362 [Chenopodium quinoa]